MCFATCYLAIAFQIMFLSRGTALRLPHGATARVRLYKSQNVFLKNYTLLHAALLHATLLPCYFQ